MVEERATQVYSYTLLSSSAVSLTGAELRKESQEDEQHSCKPKLCYLPTVLHVICKRVRSMEEEKLGETATEM
jgi:hypothetical protein